ncbi:MAG: hypothetical protein AAB483_04300 [Patescibacteria group bacterium]
MNIEDPFHEPLHSAKFRINEEERTLPQLRTILGHENKIIREAPFSYFHEDHPWVGDTPEAVVATSRKLHNELLESYHIPSAPTEYVISGKNSEKSTIYVITERIQGERIQYVDLKKISDEEKASFSIKMEELYMNLTRYLFDKIRDGGLYCADIFSDRQFVYGKAGEYDQAKIYLVDVDLPEIQRAESESTYYLFAKFRSIIWYIEKTEQQLQVRLVKARQNFVESLQALPRSFIERGDVDEQRKLKDDRQKLLTKLSEN